MNLRVKNKFKNISDNFFWGQHPEAKLRYLPVISAIEKANISKPSILEIGSGSLGIVPYLKVKVDGLDINFNGPQSTLLNKIKGSAVNLPFKNKSYDITLSVDVLEHLLHSQRVKAIHEQIRTTKSLAIIVVPCGREAQKQDKNLADRWDKIFKQKNQFLEEHVQHGLPLKEDILYTINLYLHKNNINAKVTTSPNLNLFIRLILMKTWITRNKFFYYLYLKGYLIFVPILKYCNFGKTYRHVFVIKFAS